MPWRTSRLAVSSSAVLVLLCLAAPAARAQVAQERVDLDAVRRIREEGLERSRIEPLAHHLTDVIGPRLTGSSAMKRANEWTASKLREWGLQNVAVEPWGEFGRGWERVRYSGRVLSPFIEPLNAQPVAWTGSTKGVVTGPVVALRIDSAADLAQYRGKLEGAIVLVQPASPVEPEWQPSPLRTPLEELLQPPRERGAPAPDALQEREARIARFRAARALRAATDSMLLSEGVAAVLSPSRRPFGILGVQGANAARDAKAPVPPPELVVDIDQYNQMWRDVAGGDAVRVELQVENRFLDDDLKAYNTLGEIPGSDKADEYVMLGAHLDSWQGGTGATDNGAGSIVMLEAMRILKALDLKPRRTIRIGLWSGEEQGLLGSRAWVKNHPEMLPEISAYVNVDNGTGRVRGIWDQGNERAIPVFEQILWPFRDLGVVAVRHGNTGGTDHLSFDAAGVPGFNFIQDPIEYGTRTHHTNADTYDQLVLDDLRQAAVVVAATVYTLANRDDMMPRKPQLTSTGSR